MTGPFLTSALQTGTCRLCSCAAIAAAASSPAAPPQSAASQSPCTLPRQMACQAKRQAELGMAPRNLEARQKLMMVGYCRQLRAGRPESRALIRR